MTLQGVKLKVGLKNRENRNFGESKNRNKIGILLKKIQ